MDSGPGFASCPLCPRKGQSAPPRFGKRRNRAPQKTEGQSSPGGHTSGPPHGEAVPKWAAGRTGESASRSVADFLEQESAPQAPNRRVHNVSGVRGWNSGGAGLATCFELLRVLGLLREP